MANSDEDIKLVFLRGPLYIYLNTVDKNMDI